MAQSQAPIQDGNAGLPTLASERKVPAWHRSKNYEFLAATLECLETPRSPITAPFAIFLAIIIVSATIWLYFGRLDTHAVAQDVIRPSGRSKTVQPVERGRVVAILVDNGANVNAGDALLELDSTETSADLESKAQDLENSKAEVARRRVEIAAARDAIFQSKPIEFDSDISPTVRRREENILSTELAQLAAGKASLEAQLAENVATKERLTASINSRARLIGLARERIDLRGGWREAGFGSRSLIIEA